MQWRCPHCGVVLAVPQNALVSGWSFSRCYKCAGFALVRKSEISVVKLDSAPPGEQVILPEASSDLSVAALGRDALQKLSQKTQESSLKQPIHFASQAKLQSHALAGEPGGSLSSNLSGNLPGNLPGTSFGGYLPNPLPDLPASSPGVRGFLRNYVGTLPIALVAIMSGTALFFQSQIFFNNGKSSATLDGEAGAYHSRTDVVGKVKPDPVAYDPTSFSNYVPNYVQRPIISDQIKEKAMAPLPKLPVAAQIMEKAVEKLPEKLPEKLEDKLQNKPLEKPIEKTEQSKIVKPLLSLEIKINKAKIRLGPGLEFPVIAMADSAESYDVMDWNDRWFKVVIPNTKGVNGQGVYGWIRNDLVRVKENHPTN